jgi:hypothetical protein
MEGSTLPVDLGPADFKEVTWKKWAPPITGPPSAQSSPHTVGNWAWLLPQDDPWTPTLVDLIDDAWHSLARRGWSPPACLVAWQMAEGTSLVPLDDLLEARTLRVLLLDVPEGTPPGAKSDVTWIPRSPGPGGIQIGEWGLNVTWEMIPSRYSPQLEVKDLRLRFRPPTDLSPDGYRDLPAISLLDFETNRWALVPMGGEGGASRPEGLPLAPEAYVDRETGVAGVDIEGHRGSIRLRTWIAQGLHLGGRLGPKEER